MKERIKLTDLCEQLKITCEAKYGAVEVPEGWLPGTHPYKVTLKFQGRRLTLPFFMGPANTKEPTAAGVLACIVSDTRAGEQTFEEFCSELDYDTDSRSHEKTWKSCRKLAPRVRKFLGDAFDKVEGAEH